MLCLFIISDLAIAKSRQMQTPCLASLQERSLGPPVSKLCPHGYEPLTVPSLLQMPCLVRLRERPLGPHVSEPCSYIYKRPFSDSTLSEPHGSESRLHVSKSRSHALNLALSSRSSDLTFLSPDPVDSLQFFDSTRSSFAEHSSCLSHISCETRFEAS